jgi:hypothetical protein
MQLSEEHKVKIGKAHKGKFVSEETKQRMSESSCKRIMCIELNMEFESIKSAEN